MFDFFKPVPKSGVREALELMSLLYSTAIDEEHLKAFSALQALAPRLGGFTKKTPLEYGALQLWVVDGIICLHFEEG